MSPNQKNLQLISQTGHRLTKPREQILATISGSPLSATQVFDQLKQKNFSINLTTIYRTLDLFCQLNIVQKVHLDDQIVRYEALANTHHHHLICETCGAIEDIPLSEKGLLKQVESKTKFKINRHNLEFFGSCIHCQQK